MRRVSPIAIPLTSSWRCSGNFHRQRLDVHLARDLRERAALAHAGCVLGADEDDRDRRGDRHVQANLLQVDVDELSAERILLVVLEDRRVRPVLTVEDDVENRVHPAAAGERPPQVALRDRDRVRLSAAAVENAGDEPLLAQPARLARAGTLARRHFQLDPFAGHLGGPW